MSLAEILAIVQGSPISERTIGLVNNIVTQGPGLSKILILTPGSWRETVPEEWKDVVSFESRESRWADQILRAARRSGCRWIVMPSYLDRYIPGAFEAIAHSGGAGDHTVVGSCLVRTKVGLEHLGAAPHGFDVFRLMFRQNYIAPGAAFLSSAQFERSRGFDPRFPTAAVLEYLLRTGPGGAILSLSQPILETEASPFLGVPPEHGARYAMETALIAHETNRIPFTPASATGILLAIAEATRHQDHAFVFGNGLGELAGHWRDMAFTSLLEDLGLPRKMAVPAPPPSVVSSDATLDPPPTRQLQVKGAVRALTPVPVWNTLKRLRRAWRSFVAPLEPIVEPGSATPRLVQITWGVRALTPVPVWNTLKRLRRAWRSFVARRR